MLRFSAIAALFWLLLVSSVCAQSIAITDLGVDNAQGSVSVGFRIVVRDAGDLLTELQNSKNYEVACSAKLYHRRAGFWDEFLGEGRYSCILSPRAIARECQVRDERGARTVEFSELQKSLNQLWSHLSLSLGSWDRIERGRAYRVVLNFQISQVSSGDGKPFFFLNRDLEPETVYELDFDY